MATWIADSAISEPIRMAFIGQTPTDVWDDNDVITFLKFDQQPADPQEFKRVARRAKAYRWFNNRLFKVITEPGKPITFRTVPPPAQRDELVLKTHTELGKSGA
jgi:hypothetical protein